MSGTDYTQTTNYGLYKPISNADINQWGSHLNANADTIDGVMHGFLPLAGGTPTGPIMITATGGSVARSAQARAADAANVLDYGADQTGVADSSVAINAAAAQASANPALNKAVYLPAGQYHVKYAIKLTNGQALFGDGRGNTIITVSDDFDPTATAVILATPSVIDPGPTIRDLRISFAQPSDVASRATFKTLAAGGTSHIGGTGVQYPWAIAAVPGAHNRISVQQVRIEAAWDGINADTACFWIDGLQICAFDIGVAFGGTVGAAILDWSHISDVEFWDFGLNTSNLQLIYQDGNTIAMRLGAQNGLNAQNISCFDSQLVFTSDASAGWFQFTNVSMDTDHATIQIANALFLQFSNIYSAIGSASARPAISASGGNVIISGFTGFTQSPQPLLTVNGANVTVTGANLTQYNTTANAVSLTGGLLRISNSSIYPGSGSAYTAPLIQQSGASNLQVNNLDMHGASGSTGIAVQFGSDAQLNVFGPVALGSGWTNVVPYGNPPSGNYGAVFVAPNDASSMQTGANSFTRFGASSHESAAYGQLALGQAQDASNSNAAFGALAGYGVTTGVSNTFIGAAAGYMPSGPGTGSNNTAIGQNTGRGLTTGGNNTLLGYQAGISLTTGSGNLYIAAGGGTVQPASGAESHVFRLGDYAGPNLMRATAINTATPQLFLDWLPASTTYANDAAAATGGVAVGQLYRNGSAVQVRVA